MNMDVLGITGIIGTGKSLAAQYLSQKYNYQLIDVDKVGHQLLVENSSVHAEVLATFATTDRSVLAKIVFNDPLKLKKLNAIMHPAINQEVYRRLAEHRSQQKRVVIEAALLFQIGLEEKCDRIICLKSSPQVIQDRLLTRGLNKQEIIARLNSAPEIYFDHHKAIVLQNNFSAKDKFFNSLDNLLAKLTISL